MTPDQLRSCARAAGLIWVVSVPSLAFGQAATLKPPTGLVSPSATKSVVGLSWTGEGGNFIVERKPLGGMYATSGRATATSYTDQKIEQFSTYVYRVRAFREVDAPGKPGGKDVVTSAPSNEITVGPPPTGFGSIAAAPKGDEDAFGRHLAMTLDANGDPAVAYNVLRAEGLNAHLFFVAWDRARYRWKAPVRVDVSGELNIDGDNREVSLAMDASTSLLAIAYQKGQGDGRGISLATSADAGATWRSEIVQPLDDDQRSQTPSVALASGSTYLVYLHDNNGVRFRTRAGTGGAFTNVIAPVPAGHTISRANAGLALDGAGQPAVFYWYNVNEGVRSVLAVWRPGQPAAVEAVDSKTGSDDGFAALAFAGTQPRVIVNVIRDDNFEDHLWFAGSSDGRTWTAPVRLPKDDQDYWSWPVSLAFDSKGRASAAITVTGGRGATLGRPKMLRSDDLRKWTPWSPDSGRLLMSVPVVGEVMFAANDKQYVAFTNQAPDRKIPAGVNLWREP